MKALQIFNKVDIPPAGVNLPVTIYENPTTIELSGSGYYRFEHASTISFSSTAEIGTTIFISAGSDLTITGANIVNSTGVAVALLDTAGSVIIREKDDLWRLISKY